MSVVMAQEELAYLLRIQGQSELRGAALDLSGGNKELESVLLGVAERTLRARGWLVFDGETVNIDKTVLGVVSFAVNAPYALAVRRVMYNHAEAKVFYLGDTLQVSLEAFNGVHTFDTVDIPPAQAVLDSMHGGFSVDDVARDALIDIPGTVLITAAQVTQDADLSDDDAARLLADSGVTPHLANLMVRFYREEWLSTVTLGSWSPGEGAINYSALTFIQGRAGWWVITPAEAENVVNLQPISLETLAAMVSDITQTALTGA